MLSVTSMLKRFQREKEKERQNMEKANQMMDATTASPFPADAVGGGGSGLTDPLLSLIGSTNDHALIQAASTVDFDIDLDSLLEVSEENLSPKSLPQAAAEMQLIKPGSGLQVQQNIQSEAESQPLTAKANVLPKPQSDQLQFLAEPSPVVRSQSNPLPEGLPPGLNKAKGFQTEKGQSSVGGASKSTDGCSSLQGTEELKVESSIFVLSPSTADKPPANPTSAPERSLLDILADQALAHEHPLDLSRDYLATAIFKPWSFGMDDRSPPLPPPPPHSSPINFPESQVVLPQLLQVGDMRSLAAPQLRNGQ
ncbi:hypothetical protein XENOCAPTIV_026876 [Xenoophorus captivus]|uniref:Ubinuclein 1 n=1 Tax=Xenoophorus captivus TaxID=1517983 RepID=A0ABV0R6R6_9TELE